MSPRINPRTCDLELVAGDPDSGTHEIAGVMHEYESRPVYLCAKRKNDVFTWYYGRQTRMRPVGAVDWTGWSEGT